MRDLNIITLIYMLVIRSSVTELYVTRWFIANEWVCPKKKVYIKAPTVPCAYTVHSVLHVNTAKTSIRKATTGPGG